MRISDWSSDVCSSDLRLFLRLDRHRLVVHVVEPEEVRQVQLGGGAGLDADRGAAEFLGAGDAEFLRHHEALTVVVVHTDEGEAEVCVARQGPGGVAGERSEEHTSALQSLLRISYAVFCLNNQKKIQYKP